MEKTITTTKQARKEIKRLDKVIDESQNKIYESQNKIYDLDGFIKYEEGEL